MRRRTRGLLGGIALLALVLAIVGWMLRGSSDAGDATLARASETNAPVMDLAPMPARPDVTSLAPLAASPEIAVAEPPALLIRGRLLAPDESPVVGARVSFHAATTRDWKESTPLVTSLSDAEGRFRFAFDAPPAGGSGIVVRADGFASLDSGGPGPQAWGDDEFTWHLRWTTSVSGVVRDANTLQPVAHALVSDGGPDIETAADGRFRIERVMVGLGARITATHPDYAPTQRDLVLSTPEPFETDLLLEPGLRIDVTVVDRQTRAPLPGAALRYSPRSEPFAFADGAGRWSFLIAPGTPRELTVTADDSIPVTWQCDTAGLSDDVVCELPLQRCAWIEGRVVDAHGAPVQGVRLYPTTSSRFARVIPLAHELLDPFGLPGAAFDWAPSDEATTDADGAFALPVIPRPEETTVTASKVGLVKASSAALALHEPGDRVRVELVLARGGSVKGRVLATDRKLQGVRVLARDASGAFAGVGELDVDDAYAIDGLPVGTLHLEAQHPLTNEVLAECDAIITADVVTEVDLIVPPRELVPIEGRVTWTNGEPAPGVWIGGSVADDPRGRLETVTTDADGRYALAVPPDGVFELTARVLAARSEPRRAVSGEHDVDFVLPEIGRLRLQLVDEDTHEPVAAVRAFHDLGDWLLWRGDGDDGARPVSRATLDVHGVVDAEVTAGPGEVTLVLTDEGYEPRTVRAFASVGQDATPQTVALRRGHEVVLRILERGAERKGHVVFLVSEAQRERVRQVGPGEGNQSFGGRTGLHLRIDDPTLRRSWLNLSADGTAVQRGLPSGRHVLLVFPDDVRLVPDTIDVPADFDAPIEVHVESREAAAPGDGGGG